MNADLTEHTKIAEVIDKLDKLDKLDKFERRAADGSRRGVTPTTLEARRRSY